MTSEGIRMNMMAEEIEIKSVQELTEITDGMPSEHFIQKESNRPVSELPTWPIPVVDLSRLLIGQEEEEESAKLRSALQNWGLFQAVGHGIPSTLLDEVRNISRSFFHQPTEVKQKFFTTEKEGYGKDEIASREQIIDWMDRLYLIVLPEKDRNTNLWPQNPVSFRNVLNEYVEKLNAVVHLILKTIARTLGLDECYFLDQMGQESHVHARFNYYPRCSRPDLVFGIKPHADGSVLTVVLQDQDVEGLQAFKDDTGWVKVPVLPDALVVNLGDQMEIMSNGQYKSPIHRVVTSSKERISIAMFYASDPEKEIEPAVGTMGEGRPRLYKKVKVKDYLESFFTDFYQGKRAIDSVRI